MERKPCRGVGGETLGGDGFDVEILAGAALFVDGAAEHHGQATTLVVRTNPESVEIPLVDVRFATRPARGARAGDGDLLVGRFGRGGLHILLWIGIEVCAEGNQGLGFRQVESGLEGHDVLLWMDDAGVVQWT